MTSLPSDQSVFERFRLAAAAGFSGVEMSTVEDPSEAERVRQAAQRTGLRIHSVVHDSRRRFPLSSADPDVIRRGAAAFEISLRNALLWGADTVSMTPTAAGPETSYQDAWDRSQRVIRDRILPQASHAGVTLAVEEVWDGFVVGPLEVARYVDAFESRWVKACFDTRRAVFYARPEDWIDVLGSRLVKVRARKIGDVVFDGWITAETF